MQPKQNIHNIVRYFTQDLEKVFILTIAKLAAFH